MFNFPIRSKTPIRHISVQSGDGRSLQPVVRELNPPATQQQLAQQQAQVTEALSAIQESLSSLEDRRQQSLRELQQFAVEMSVAIASQLVGRQLQTDDTIAVQLAEKAVAQLQTTGDTTLRLNPEDAQQVQAAIADSEQKQAEFANVSIVADAALPRGACQAMSEAFGLRIDPATHLESIREALLESIDAAQTERRDHATVDSEMRRFPDRRETA